MRDVADVFMLVVVLTIIAMAWTHACDVRPERPHSHRVSDCDCERAPE